MFGAFSMGDALASFGDVAKGKGAAEKIYNMILYPSSINAVEMDDDKTLIMAENLTGVIEFKNVWFRYPTRTEDFVLKGLNLNQNAT